MSACAHTRFSDSAYGVAMHAWLNGRMVDPHEAQIAIDDHGLIVGDGAFETLKTVRGDPLALTRHLRRLRVTLEALAIPSPPESQIRKAISECLAAAGHDTARIRLTVTAGSGSLGSSAPSGPASLFVIVTELAPRVPGTAITVPWTRNERGALAGLKTTSYAGNVRALRAAHEAGAHEAIFANTKGELCEGTGTNVFVVVDGECSTPPLSSGCLAGITRELVLEVGDVHERALRYEVLTTADEVFVTSSTRDVQGLIRIDDRDLSSGPVTRSIAEKFAALIAETTDP